MHHGIAVRRVLVFALLLPCVACDAILGLGQFTFDGSIGDASDECVGPNGCWACTPTTNDQFLNACGGQCVTFDTTRVTPFLTADGSLPPLPPIEAGAEGGGDAAVADADGGGG